MARLIEKVDLWCGAFREVMVVDRLALATGQILNPDRHPSGSGQGCDVDVVTLLAHWLYLLP